MNDRYALYFAPPAGSDVARFADSWLGRNAESGALLDRPALNGIAAERARRLTEAPRHYGFHGTLKPPFHLPDGCNGADLDRAVVGFAARQRSFAVPKLCLRALGDFVALVPEEPVPALSALADACVTEFDGYRAPPSTAELAKRHAAGLSPRQAELLARWGYPYVLDEFRFHLSLTGSIVDPTERARIVDALTPMVEPLTWQLLPVREICLFHQPDRTTPFRLVARFPFGS